MKLSIESVSDEFGSSGGDTGQSSTGIPLIIRKQCGRFLTIVRPALASYRMNLAPAENADNFHRPYTLWKMSERISWFTSGL